MSDETDSLLETLDIWQSRFEELDIKISQQMDGFDTPEYATQAKEHSRLASISAFRTELIDLKQKQADAQELLDSKDEEFAELAEEEISSLNAEQETLIKKIKKALLPPDPNSGKNVILEIRSAAGGDEAALFAADLFRMYKRHAEINNWKVETLSTHATEGGGVKEITLSIIGSDAYDRLKFETGTHRVQRVPATEASGRIHTSTATVAVLPEAEDFEVEINDIDLEIQTFRSSGPGGQHVNTTDSAVRIIHKPSGVVVSCQDEKSQLKNKTKAMRVLRARIYEIEKAKIEAELRDERRSQIKGGDRSDKIRTYNFPDNRLTDHRINFKVTNLTGYLNGDMVELQNASIENEQKLLMTQLENTKK